MTYRLYFPKLTKSQFQNPNGDDVYECDRYAYSIRKTYRLVEPYEGLIGVWDLPFIQSRNIVTFGDLVAKIPKMVSDDCEVVICITGDDNREFLEKISVGWFWYLMDKYEKPKNYEVIKTARIEKCKLITVETRMTFCVDLKMVDIIDACLKYNLSNDREWNPSLFKTLELKRYGGASNEPDFDGDTFTIVDAKNKKHKYSSLYGEQKK